MSLTFSHQLRDSLHMSFASQYSDNYCTLIKLLWMNASMQNRSCVCNFANQVDFENVTAKLVGFCSLEICVQ